MQIFYNNCLNQICGKRTKKAMGVQNLNQAINHYKTELIKEPNYQIKILILLLIIFVKEM